MKYDVIFNGVVKDYFVYEGNEIVVLSNAALGINNNNLLLGRISHGENISQILPLDEEEYAGFARYYKDLKMALTLKEENNE